MSGRFWPTSAQIGATLVDSNQIWSICRPIVPQDVVELWPHSQCESYSRFQAKLGRLRPLLCEEARHVEYVGRIRAKFGQTRPNLDQLGPHFDRGRPNVGQNWLDLGSSWAMQSGRFGQTSACIPRNRCLHTPTDADGHTNLAHARAAGSILRRFPPSRRGQHARRCDALATPAEGALCQTPSAPGARRSRVKHCTTCAVFVYGQTTDQTTLRSSRGHAETQSTLNELGPGKCCAYAPDGGTSSRTRGSLADVLISRENRHPSVGSDGVSEPKPSGKATAPSDREREREEGKARNAKQARKKGGDRRGKMEPGLSRGSRPSSMECACNPGMAKSRRRAEPRKTRARGSRGGERLGEEGRQSNSTSFRAAKPSQKHRITPGLGIV